MEWRRDYLRQLGDQQVTLQETEILVLPMDAVEVEEV
jgi:hypothetical protein